MLLLWDRRRWRSELGHCRNVLRNGVVEGRRLPVCWALHSYEFRIGLSNRFGRQRESFARVVEVKAIEPVCQELLIVWDDVGEEVEKVLSEKEAILE